MRRFRDLPIRRKLLTLMVGLTGMVLLPTVGIFVVSEYRMVRRQLEERVAALADILSEGCAAALESGDAEAAGRILESLHRRPPITSATLMDARGRVVARYGGPAEGRIRAAREVRAGDRRLGTLRLQADTEEIWIQITPFLWMAGLLLAVSLAAAALLASLLQRLISDPLLRLTRAARRISETGDVRLRVPGAGRDEVGELGEVVNAMLDRIERKEAALYESEEQFRTFFELSASGKAQLDPRTQRFVRVNPKYCEITGYSSEELLRMTLRDVTHPDDRAADEAYFRAPLPEYNREKRYIRKDGRVIWVQVVAKLIYDAAGRPLRSIGVIHDISKRKAVEEALRASEARFRKLAEEVRIVAWESDARTWRLLYVGPYVVELLGYPREAWSTPNFWIDHVHPEDRDWVARYSRESSAAKENFDFEYRLVAADGRSIWVRDVVSVVREDGEPRLLRGFLLDISARKQAEEELRLQRDRLSTLYEIDRGILAAQTPRTIAQAVVPLLPRLIPYRRLRLQAFGSDGPETLLNVDDRGEPATEPELPPELRGDPRQLQTGRLQVLDDLRTLPESPSLRAWLDAGLRSVAVVPLAAEGGLIGILQLGFHEPGAFTPEHERAARELAAQLAVALRQSQLTEEVRRRAADLEERVRERTADLEAANQELEAFSYSISHDLRAPLRAVDGFAWSLVEDYGPQLPPEARDRLERVAAAARRMGRLIDDLLDFSRLGRRPLRRALVFPSALARAAIEELRGAQAGRRVDIAVEEMPPCRGDPALLKQVFVNLIDNALKYTRTRDPAVVRIGAQEGSRPGERHYYVRDNGVGFDMRRADRLFGVFQRLHREEDYEGTGVGLAIVKRIIQRHGGRVWAESEPGRGAAFYVALEGVEPVD